MLFAVATTKTGFVFSCNQVRKVANILCDEELSPKPCAKPFSISSTHNIEGATASAVIIAFLIFSSELPSHLL